jgi:putative transposase
MARVVVPGIPHHITQRGNRRQRVFFRDEDYQEYLNLLSHWCGEEQVEVWSYCLMPNHYLCEASHNTCNVKSPIM